MANDPQTAGGTQWDDPSLTDASKLHAKIKGRYSGGNINNETYVLKDASLHWDKDDYAYLFKDRLTKEFRCEQNNSKLSGFGPWCDFQDIGRGREHQCIFEERRKCIAQFVASLQAFPPRSPWNAVNTITDNRTAINGDPRRYPLDSVAATQAREEWQRTGEPPLTGSFCLPYLSNVSQTLCERGKSGLVSIKAVQKALQKCLSEVNKKCQCSNCDALPDEDEEYKWDRDPDEPANPTDEPTDDDGEPAPSMSRQSTTLSSYEIPIPIAFGRISVKGNIIWVGGFSTEEVTFVEPLTPDTETAPEVVTKTVLIGSIAIGLCEGTIEGVSKIVFGNRVVFRGAMTDDFDPYDVEVENAKQLYGNLEDIVETTKRVSFTVYQGEEAQKINPRMAAIDGPNRSPAYRGLTYLFIDNLPISEFASNGLPNVTVEVYTRTVPGAIPSLISTELVDTVMEQYDPEFLAVDVQNDRLYVSGGNSGQTTHGIRVLNSRNLVEVVQQTPTAATPSSMVLTRSNTVMYQERDFDKAKVHWYAPDYDLTTSTFGDNEVGDGHGYAPSSLAAFARPLRGPAVLTLTGYTDRFDNRKLWPVELLFLPSKFDDIARFQTLGDTHVSEEIGSRVLGYPDQDPSLCASTCLTSYTTSCVDYCTYIANGGGPVGDCTYDPPTITVNDGLVYDLSTESVIGPVDYIDTDGSIYVVGNPVPVGVQDCSDVVLPGDIPPDPLCIADCTLDAEAYCESFCGSGTRIIEAIIEGRRDEIDPLAQAQTAQGAMIVYRPYTVSPYSNMTSLEIEWLHVASTEDDMAVDPTFLPAVYRTLPMSLWGNNASAILAQVITIPGAREHVFFIKTSSGPDYAFRYNHENDEVIWERTLPARLPATFSANDRKLEYPNTDYVYIALDGSIVLMELFEGAVEIVGTMATSSLPSMTGAQVYDPRDQSVTYVNTTSIVKVFPTRAVIDDVGLDEIAARVFALAGLGPHEYDVSALASTRVVGYIIEDFGDAKEFLVQIREMFGLYATDSIPVRFGPPNATAVGNLTRAVLLGRDGEEFAETRKWQDRRYTDVTIVALNPADYHGPITTTAKLDERDSSYAGERRFETKFAFFRGQAEAIAEQYLALHQVTRGDLAFGLGPLYAHVSPGDTFSFEGRDGISRKYVVNTTLNQSLPNMITATTIESISSLSFTPPVVKPRVIKPIRKAALIFTNAITDADARAVMLGNQVVYGGIESTEATFAPREFFAFGRARLTDVVSSGMSPSSAIRFPTIGKALHSGTALPLAASRLMNICDRTSVLTVTFDRAETLDLMTDATEIEVINSPTKNLLVYDGEQIQFLTMTRVSDHVAEFRGLYRGRNGTEAIKDLVRQPDRSVRVYYYTADTFVSATVVGETYAGRPWVEAVVADTRVGRNWHVPALYQAYDYGSRLWAPTHIKATRLQAKPYAYPDVKIEWTPRSPLTERENLEFTPYLASEKYVVYVWSYFPNGDVPIDDFDEAVYRNIPGNSIMLQTPVIQGRRSVTITEAEWRAIGFNTNNYEIYLIVAQVNPATGEIGLPGAGVSSRP